jgi:hypothetical protein
MLWGDSKKRERGEGRTGRRYELILVGVMGSTGAKMRVRGGYKGEVCKACCREEAGASRAVRR